MFFSIFYLCSSEAQSSTSLCPEVQLIWFKLESVISFEINEGQIACHNVINGAIRRLAPKLYTFNTPAKK